MKSGSSIIKTGESNKQKITIKNQSTIKGHTEIPLKEEFQRRLSGKTSQHSLHNFSCVELKGRTDWLEHKGLELKPIATVLEFNTIYPYCS